MNIYSSREGFTDDPKPMVDPFSGRRAEYADEALGWRWHPRSEFERPQHNATNPILVRFREGNGYGGFPVAYWAHRLGKGDAPDGVEATSEQIEHARLVLSRLARFQEVG